MNFLIIDCQSTGLALAMRATQAGHNVKFFVMKDRGERCQVGDGVPGIERVPHWEPWMKWADLVWLTDNAKYLNQLEPYRKLGYPIFGPSVESARLELEREHGMKVLRDYGVKTIDSKIFHDYESAERYIRNEYKKDKTKRFVSKPCGEMGDNKAMTYVAKSAKDMIYMLGRWAKNPKYRSMVKKYGFLMQEFVPGVEMGVSGWMGSKGFVGPWNENFEFKKLMPGDYGVNTGEMGTIVRYVKKSKLADILLKPLEEHLLKIGHRGDVDVNAKITPDGKVLPLEWTTRAGWPYDVITRVLHVGDPINWMSDALDGKDTIKVREKEIAAGYVYAIPDFPFSKFTKKEVTGVPVYGVNGSKHFHPQEMMMGLAPLEVGDKIVDAPMLVSTGDYVAVVTGTGDTVQKAARAGLRRVKRLEIPNDPIVRIDIGGRLRKQLPELQKHGFAMGMRYSDAAD